MKIRTLVSYLPNISDALLADLIVAIRDQDKSRISEILLQYEIVGGNIITGARWIDDSTVILSIASVEKSFEHIKLWSDNRINEYFNVDITPYKEGYELSVWPDTDKTIRRHELQYLMNNDEFTTGVNYTVLFCPLRFKTDKGYVPDKLPDKITIGFADSSAKCRDYKITLNDVYAIVKDIPVVPIRRTQ